MINIQRVAETQIVSVRKRNIQGRYNSVRHLQRRYLELPPLQLLQIQVFNLYLFNYNLLFIFYYDFKLSDVK